MRHRRRFVALAGVDDGLGKTAGLDLPFFVSNLSFYLECAHPGFNCRVDKRDTAGKRSVKRGREYVRALAKVDLRAIPLRYRHAQLQRFVDGQPANLAASADKRSLRHGPFCY